MKSITATLRLEIVKPVDGDWDDFGRTIRALRAPLHRVLNGVVTDLEIEKRVADESGVKGKHPQTRAYQITGALWKRERDAAVARIAAGKPYAGDEAIAEVEPGSSLVLGAATAAYTKWQKYRKEAWRGSMTLPTFRGSSPVFVVGAGVGLDVSDGNHVLRLNLKGGRGVASRLIVKVDGGSAHADLRRIVDGAAKLGDCRVVEDDRGGKRKWFALVSHTREIEDVTGGRTMALHRGVTTFLTAAIGRDGEKEALTRVIAYGKDILAHKDAYSARRRSLGQHSRELGAGAKGHGKARREEHITRLQDADARWVENKCRQIAADAMRLGESRGVTRIVLDDWTNPASAGAPHLGEHVEKMIRRFPLAQLRTSIEWAAKKRGWTVDVVSGADESRECPGCGHVHDAPPVRVHHAGEARIFVCERCKLERAADAIAAWNMLRRAGSSAPVSDAVNAGKRTAGRLRKRR